MSYYGHCHRWAVAGNSTAGFILYDNVNCLAVPMVVIDGSGK
jgi:hypothetical protein